MSSDEVLDIVNGFDEVIGTVKRSDYRQFLKDDLGYVRSADLFIVNDQGQLWIPVRTLDKAIAPGGYDYSAGGHVESGEDYLTTIIRETKEEINLDITAEQVEFVAKLKSVSIKYIRTIYLLRSNDSPVFNPDDFTAAAWLTPAELLQNINDGHPAKSNLRDTVTTLLTYLSGR